MTSPFSKDYVPKVDQKEIARSAKRSRDATASAERLGLKAIPAEGRPFKDRVAGKKPGRVLP